MPLVDVYEEVPVDYFVRGFRQLGYEPCEDRGFEFGYQKIAIYANDAGVQHMARQHFWGGGWLTKAGLLEDFLHLQLEDIEGDMWAPAREYGRVAKVLKRSWFVAMRFGLFREWWEALKFAAYRLVHPSWIWDNIRRKYEKPSH